MKKHSKDPSKNWKQSGIDCSRMIHQDRFWLMVLVASLWNRGPSMNYVASFSWFLSLPSPYHYFFPTVHHQTFLHFSTLPLLTNVDIIFGRPPQLEIAKYMKVNDKVNREKSRGEGSLIVQDTIENVSEPNFFFNFLRNKNIYFLVSFNAKNVFTV